MFEISNDRTRPTQRAISLIFFIVKYVDGTVHVSKDQTASTAADIPLLVWAGRLPRLDRVRARRGDWPEAAPAE